jgi:dolichol-phosphate mannosyltransferase
MTLPKTQGLDLSVIIPVKDESESITVLADELGGILELLSLTWECLWIDDGSTDASQACIESLHQRDARHHLIALDGNYGQSGALYVGFMFASGRVFVTLDGDLQSDPHDIPRLLEVLRAGKADMVNGVRVNRKDTMVRRISSMIANGFRNWMTGEQVTDVGCSLRAFRYECVENIPLWKGMHRFIPTLAHLNGYQVTEIPVNHRQRSFGETKYSIGNRLWVGLYDTLAVQWMQNRFVHPRVVKTSKRRD